MTNTYGANVTTGDTRGQPPLKVESEITAIWGTFPCTHEVEVASSLGKPEQWYACTSWTDYKNQFGFEEIWGSGNLNRSDGWNAVKSVERLMKNGMYPVLIYNVLDPATDQADIVDENVIFTATALTQPVAQKYALLDTFVIQDVTDTTTYVEGTDYSLALSLGVVQITRIATGAIGATDTIHVDYSYCTPAATTDLAFTTAIALADNIITDLGFSYLPGRMHCPYRSKVDYGATTYAAIRGALLTAATTLNSSTFKSRFHYDLDESSFITSGTLQDLYDEKTVASEYGRAHAASGTMTTGETEQLGSDWYIFMQMNEVNNNGWPGTSCSNRVMENFTPDMDLTFPTQSNAIRDKGIITTCLDPGDRGYVMWGTSTSYYAGTSTDLAKDSSNQNDTLVYLTNLITRDLWVASVDRNFNSILLDDILDKWNSLGKMQVSKGNMLGFEIYYLPEDNTPSTLLSQITYRIRLLAPEPAARIDVVMQVDLTYFDNLFPA